MCRQRRRGVGRNREWQNKFCPGKTHCSDATFIHCLNRLKPPTMGKSCCALNCTNRFKKGLELPFYRLPKAKEKRGQWIRALRINNWNPDATETWICGRHFVSGMFCCKKTHACKIYNVMWGPGPFHNVPFKTNRT